MKNFGISVADITDKDGELRLSILSLWVENSSYFHYGRSLFAVEKNAKQIAFDLFFMRFSTKL